MCSATHVVTLELGLDLVDRALGNLGAFSNARRLNLAGGDHRETGVLQLVDALGPEAGRFHHVIKIICARAIDHEFSGGADVFKAM